AQVAGNMSSGIMSQYFQSRKKVIFFCIMMALVCTLILLLIPFKSPLIFYILCAGMGFFNGYWTLFITVAAELFGSDLRATVATTVPNFVRGSVIPLTMAFALGKNYVGVINSALIVGLITFAIAII